MNDCYMKVDYVRISVTREKYWHEIPDVLLPILHALHYELVPILNGVKLTKFEIYGHSLCRFCVRSLFCCAVLCVISSFAIISLRKREQVALLYFVTVRVLCPFSTVLWFGLQCVIMTFPGHTHLFLYTDVNKKRLTHYH